MSDAAHGCGANHPLSTPDVTVVVPTYLGGSQIGRCLRSLAQQTLDPERFEVVIVQNGPPDDTGKAIEAIRAEWPQLRLRVIMVAESGVGRARNIGMAAARGAFLTFVDDDDAVSPEYLSGLLDHSGPDVVALAMVADVASADSPPNFGVRPGRWQLPHSGEVVPAESLIPALGYTVAKLVPTPLARSVRFDTSLYSGEDIVYWATILATAPISFAVCPIESHAVYYRLVRPNSVSRRQHSRGFSVTQRLDVMQRLEALVDPPARLAPVVSFMKHGQAGFINSYLRGYPNEHASVIAEIHQRGLRSVPYRRVNEGLARDLAILYVAPPYSDTSGAVAARRIAAAGRVVDVISCSWKDVKRVDASTDEIWRPYVDRRYETPTRPVSAWWPAMVDYARRGMAKIEEWVADKGSYERMYSRVMLPSAHLLAAWYKVRNPDVEWVAEFSDPILFNMNHERRVGSGRPDPDLLGELGAALGARGFPPPEDDNPYVWIEALAFGLADTILFTNENQRAYMLGHFPDRALADRAEQVGLIAAHPAPQPHLYRSVSSDYPLDPGRINIAFFGVFYATRGLAEVVSALQRLSAAERERIALHVFTADPDALNRDLAEAGLVGTVRAQPYVDYLEYLNLLTRFDVLLVNDARTADTHAVNPYLPSKWSEYSGSGRPVWGVVEPGSMLSAQSLAYRSFVGDVAGAHRVLLQLVAQAPADRSIARPMAALTG